MAALPPNRESISPDDWRRVAEILGDVASAETLHDMVDVLIRRAHDLFAAELVICDRFDEQARQLSFQMYPAARDEFHQQMVPAFVAHWHQHPYQARWVEEIGGGRIGFLSDRITNREFRETGLWNEVYIHLRAKNQVLVGGAIETNRFFCLSMNRLGRDFATRERELGRFLQPRLTRLFQRQSQRETAWRTAELIAHPDAATLIADPKGRILEASETARSALNADGLGGRVIPELARSQTATAPARAITNLVIDGLHAVAFRPAENGFAVVMLDQRRNGAAGPDWKLTAREAEILHWIAEGKTNPEIGLLLGISARTVAKHCEQLFAKLGVENRFGAAALSRHFG